MDERMGKREGGMVEGWDGRKERREEEGRQDGVEEGVGGEKEERGEGELGEQGGKEGTAPRLRKCAPAARPSSTSENSSQVTLTRRCPSP